MFHKQHDVAILGSNMAGPNFLSSFFLLLFAKFLLYLSPNLYGSQHDYVDFGLNETFACKKATKVGFEAFYHSSRFRIAHGGMSQVTSNKMSMRFLLSMLLLNGNVETNPRPQYNYPCGDCQTSEMQSKKEFNVTCVTFGTMHVVVS